MPRRLVTVQGIVQGVGFRPFVFELAGRLELGGCVRNEGGSVVIEIEGAEERLERFLAEMRREAPRRASIQAVQWASAPERGERSFCIAASAAGGQPVVISPDIATCERCLAELADPADRRFRYPFINCTHCGPRLTIVTAAPYDRPRTTMAHFAMCAACRREYADPADRRFHAQPIACPVCGPRLALLDAAAAPIGSDEPLRLAAQMLLERKIGAIKGLGGYHLACDARSEAAVADLRRRKHRDARPFAIMVRNVAAARELGDVSPQEERLLASPASPIVLLKRRGDGVAAAVAPGNPCLGVMLPYTPLHHLLLEAVGGAPLVMTSGNRSDEPIAYDDRGALAQLAGLADFFLTHNRPIHTRCDDSVLRVVGGRMLPLRRSRGLAPAPLALPVACARPTLALGGQLKGAFALGRGEQAVLSHHLGDLDYFEAYRSFVEAVEHYEALFDVQPELIVHDLHPDYATTRYAAGRRQPAVRLAVQHHHAHLASCLAEHGLDQPAIGAIFDGTGYGSDGAVWGGEFLIGGYRGFRRAAHLRYVPMPGGEQAIREPWRMAAAQLADAGLEWHEAPAGVPAKSAAAVRQMIAGRLHAPLTSSAGRLFDAVAAIIGVRTQIDFEGQAAMELEWLAGNEEGDGGYPVELLTAGESPEHPLQIDTRPLIAAVHEDVQRGAGAAVVARRFHSTLVEMIAIVCGRLREETGLETVALSGGVFMNALLLGEAVPRLERDGFRVLRHERVPPNDGGLCLGQLAIAAALDSRDNAAVAS